MKYSFLPIEDGLLEVLILGSLPGDRSIAENQYYAHPRNRFWTLMAKLLKQELPSSYDERIQMLLKAHIGLWDVAHSAVRSGSADTNIECPIPNNIPSLISRNHNLKTIVFNGKKAEALFKKFISTPTNIRILPKPSTSPANARMDLEALAHEWQKILE